MIIYKVEEMSCSHCVSRIHDALEGACIKHEISLENKTVSVEADTSLGDNVVELLDDLGFCAVVVES